MLRKAQKHSETLMSQPNVPTRRMLFLSYVGSIPLTFLGTASIMFVIVTALMLYAIVGFLVPVRASVLFHTRSFVLERDRHSGRLR